MQAIQNILSMLQIQQGISSVGSFLVNHALQTVFFTIFVSNCIALFLKFIGFAYAQSLAHNIFIKILGIILMWYVKIWDHYTGILYISSVFSLGVVSIYVYGCCGNISESFDNWKTNNRDWAIISSYTFMFCSTAYVFYSIYAQKENPQKYDYSGIYFLLVMLILLGNMIRGRSVIYTLIGIVTMNYLVGTRYLINIQTSDTIYAQIPFAVIPYFMMAFDAHKREEDQCRSQIYPKLFMACIALSAYSLLNDNRFPLELVLGGVFVFGIIINR